MNYDLSADRMIDAILQFDQRRKNVVETGRLGEIHVGGNWWQSCRWNLRSIGLTVRSLTTDSRSLHFSSAVVTLAAGSVDSYP